MEDREIAVMLEGMKGDFRAFGEGLAAVREELKATKNDLRQEMRELRHELREELQETNRRLDETKQELTKLMNGVLTILDRHDISIEDLEKRVARLERRAR